MVVPVHTVAQYSLQCANEASVASLESPFKLGPLDELVLPFVPIQNVFVYRKPASSETKLLPIERLRQALPYLLDHYPHLTGRLQFNPETHTPSISRPGTGAVLHEARCDVQLDELVPSDRASGRLLVTDLPDCGTALTPPFDPSIDGVCRDPLLAIQHTRFACGGLVLGIRLHHIVCDAGGYFQLVRDMAEVYQGLSSFPYPSLKCAPQKPTKYISQNVEKPEKPPITGRVLRFNGNQLQELKRLATDPSGNNWVSTFEALSAYLYQQVYRARFQLLLSQGVSPSEAAERLFRGFWASINMRDARRLNLGQNYFPNAVYPIYGTLSHELLMNGDLWMVTKALHDLVRSVDVQQMEQTTRWIAVQPDKSRIRVNFTFADGNFTVSQWSGFKMYVGVDFDVDSDGNPVHPILVAPPLTEISRVDALAMILSTDEDLAEQDSGRPSAVDVNLTLTEPLWSILDSDEEVRKHYR